MNIVDTNAITHILKNNLTLSKDYYLAPDVVEESDLAEMVHNRRIPNKIMQLSEYAYFDEGLYLNHYKKILNKYGGRSFYNMTGFGDVSILAVIHMLVDTFEKENRARLFGISEQIVVFTDDNGLTTKIGNEFSGKDVVIKLASDIL